MLTPACSLQSLFYVKQVAGQVEACCCSSFHRLGHLSLEDLDEKSNQAA